MSRGIQVYPFECQLISGKETVMVQIIKLTELGFLANTLALTLQVNDVYQANFILPVKNQFIETETLVLKTYDEFKGVHGLVQPGNHVTELGFRNLSPEGRKIIHQFLINLKKI